MGIGVISLTTGKMVSILEEQQIGQNGTRSSKSTGKDKMVPILARATERTKWYPVNFLVALKLSSDFDQVQISINYKKIILKFFALSVALARMGTILSFPLLLLMFFL
jgi:hypothetical protein